MAIEMYRGVTGWREVDVKHSATHMLLSVDEYNDLKHEIKKANEERDNIKFSSKQYKKDIDEQARAAIAQADNNTNEIKEKLLSETAERQYQEQLNENLLRINKERSNSNRKLQPKKEHTGYVVIQSQEKEVRYTKDRKPLTYTAWETTIQSPYNVDFTEEQARTQIDRDLTSNYKYWLLGNIGIDGTWYTDLYTVLKDDNLKEENYAFQQRLRANFKAGYWEVIYLHTKALSFVPKNMRAK